MLKKLSVVLFVIIVACAGCDKDYVVTEQYSTYEVSSGVSDLLSTSLHEAGK